LGDKPCVLPLILALGAFAMVTRIDLTPPVWDTWTCPYSICCTADWYLSQEVCCRNTFI